MLEEAEWKSVYVIAQGELPPDEPPTLREMVRMAASSGGFIGRKRDGRPGPKTLWIGLQRMHDLALARQTFGPSPDWRDV